MPNLNVNILGRDGNTRAKVTGQEELLVSIGSFGPSASGLATESTLKNIEGLSNLILAAIQAGTEYEAALVIDAADVTWLEVRVYNQSTGSFDAPVYYQAGSNSPGTPIAPITYINPNSYLAQIVTNTSSVTRTPGIIRTVGPAAGTIAPLVYDFSVSNVGSGNGLILGVTIKPGETLNFSAGALNNSYAANTITYNGTGTELVIIYNA